MKYVQRISAAELIQKNNFSHFYVIQLQTMYFVLLSGPAVSVSLNKEQTQQNKKYILN